MKVVVSLFFWTTLAWAQAASPIKGTLRLSLQPWEASCARPASPGEVLRCDPPRAVGPERFLEQELAPVYLPGQAADRSQDFKLSAQPETLGRLTVWSVYPYAHSNFPPYLQMRIDLAQPVRFSCMELVHFHEPMEMPPLICAGYEARADGSFLQRGLTLKLAPEQALR